MIMIFVSLVDTFTPWHLKVLKFFQNPTEWATMNGLSFENLYMGAPAHILEQAFNELRGRRELYDKLVKDLYANGLMSTDLFTHDDVSEWYCGLKNNKYRE